MFLSPIRFENIKLIPASGQFRGTFIIIQLDHATLCLPNVDSYSYDMNKRKVFTVFYQDCTYMPQH